MLWKIIGFPFIQVIALNLILDFLVCKFKITANVRVYDLVAFSVPLLYQDTNTFNSWPGPNLFVENEILLVRTGTNSNGLYTMLEIVIIELKLIFYCNPILCGVVNKIMSALINLCFYHLYNLSSYENRRILYLFFRFKLLNPGTLKKIHKNHLYLLSHENCWIQFFIVFLALKFCE
jgi:hypothetical protein